MSRHSVVEAKNNLSDLIARAERGEEVVITRHGAPVVELRPIKPAGRAMTEADMDWLDEQRIPRRNSDVDAGSLVSQMRDEDWR